MKGRKGMVDWARNSEDRVVIPKNIFTPMSTGKEAYQHVNFVLANFNKGTQNLCLIGPLYDIEVVIWSIFKRNPVPTAYPRGKWWGLNFSTLNKKWYRNPRGYFLCRRANAYLLCTGLYLCWWEVTRSAALRDPLKLLHSNRLRHSYRSPNLDRRMLSRQITLASETIDNTMAVQISDIREFPC